MGKVAEREIFLRPTLIKFEIKASALSGVRRARDFLQSVLQAGTLSRYDKDRAGRTGRGY